MITFNSWTDTHQISAAPNSHRYVILLFGKYCFKTKWIAFFAAKSRCFLPRLRSPAKAMRYADETLSFQDSAIRAT